MSFGVDSIMVDTLLKLKKSFNFNVFVETGTDRGLSLKVLHPYFSKLYSCEITKERWQYYDELLENNKVKIQLGSSLEWLPTFFKEIGNDKFFLFLDAHCQGNYPILDELKIVSDFNYKPVIIIHDFDNGKGFSYIGKQLYTEKKIYGNPITDSLNFDYVKESIEKIYGKDGYIFETNKKCEVNTRSVGCAYFYPNK